MIKDNPMYTNNAKPSCCTKKGKHVRVNTRFAIVRCHRSEEVSSQQQTIHL